MIEAPAKVVSVEPGYALVAAERRAACGDCGSRQSCGVSTVGQWLGSKVHTVRLPNPLGVEPGDSVVVGLSEDRLLGAAVVAYLVPLVAMIALAIIGSELSDSQAAPVMLGLVGLLGGLWCSSKRSMTTSASYQPRILRRQPGVDCAIDTNARDKRSAA